MDKVARSEQFALVRWVRERGIPIDEVEFRRMEAMAGGLIIQQTGEIVMSSASDLESGGTAFIIQLVLQNCSDRPLAPVHVKIEVPWVEPEGVRLLEDPARKRPREISYEFPGRRLCPIEREAVLNHRIGRNRPVMPRDSIDGFVLAVGEAPIPAEYCDRARIRIHVTLFDQHGGICRQPFDLMASRERRRPDRAIGHRVSRKEYAHCLAS